jgi:GNAT superfamily N-acetyltransferase
VESHFFFRVDLGSSSRRRISPSRIRSWKRRKKGKGKGKPFPIVIPQARRSHLKEISFSREKKRVTLTRGRFGEKGEILAKVGGKTIGKVSYYDVEEGIEIAGIWVEPEYQHRGVARTFIENLQRNHRGIKLHTRKKLRKFWEQFGFRVIKKQRYWLVMLWTK